MKLKKINIRNVLSYNEEEIEFNKDLNIFVGANGSGKSNLLNIIIYILKRYCYKNYEITKSYGIESIGHAKYSIREKNPLYNSSEDFFLSKHKLLKNKPSSISFTIEFEKNDVKNFEEIKKYEKEIIDFLDYKVDRVSFIGDRYSVQAENVKSFFDIKNDDLIMGQDITIKLKENKNIWIIENEEQYSCIKFLQYFTLIYNLLNIMEVDHKVKNPFVFFEAYRNNSKDTTLVSISDFNNNYINTQTIANMENLAYSIGINSTYIMLATRKYGEIHRKCIEEENGLNKFNNNPEYKKLKSFFEKFDYDINLKCIEPNNNIYQFYLIKDKLEIEIDAISSGEREVINFIFGLFLEQLEDSIVIIDEPELHLHPNWQKKLIQILKDETNNKNIQIMFVTHSSSFIAYNTLNNLYRIYKENGFSKCVCINDLFINDEDKLRKNLSVINATNNEKIFFSKYVILVEGITDEILFKKIYESEVKNIKDGIEWVSISGKNNYDNFKNILDKLKIKYFYIGDYDNLYEFDELKLLFEVDKKKQKKDLERTKNQSYSCLDLLKSIHIYINNPVECNFSTLKTNFELYNNHFLKNKKDITKEEMIKIDKLIDEKYKDNFYILKKGEIENYLGTGSTNKTLGFKKVITLLNDADEYEKFKKLKDFEELKFIVDDINKKIMREEQDND